MTARFWKELGIENEVRLEINNLGDEKARKYFSESLVDFLSSKKNDLDEDSKETVGKPAENFRFQVNRDSRYS